MSSYSDNISLSSPSSGSDRSGGMEVVNLLVVIASGWEVSRGFRWRQRLRLGKIRPRSWQKATDQQKQDTDGLRRTFVPVVAVAEIVAKLHSHI